MAIAFNRGLPKDWTCSPIEIVMSDISMGPFGSNIKVENFQNHGVPVLNGYNIKDILLNDIISNYVSHQKASELKKAVAKQGDIVITHRGTLGQIAIIPYNSKFKEYVISQSQFRVTLNADIVDSLFIVYYFHSTSGQDNLLEMKGHTGVPALAQPTTNFRKVSVPRPPLPEQRAIAAALSDADSYIVALEQLITKKRDIKQGAMQELLTGKRRLPGFTGEWTETPLGEVLKVGHGKSQRGIETASGKYPILATGGVIGRTNVFLYDKPSVLIGRKGTIDKPQYMDTPFWTIDTLYYTIINDESYPKYLYYLFCTIDWGSLNEASGVPSLSANIIEKLQIILPEKHEQTAIAAILSDIDTEIDALTAQLDKARCIKQGMMQELLTGRIRLLSANQDIAQTSKTVEPPAVETVAKRHEGYSDAVILVALVNAFGTEQHPFTAFDCQKFPYLFHRHMEGVAKGFGKFAAGPYNPDYKYRTAQPIALKKSYIREHTSSYRGYVTDTNAQEALTYFAQWYGDEPLKWLEQFRYIPKRKDELELLTTTDKAMVELRGKGAAVCLQSIKELIKQEPAWKNKLTRPIFSDDNISRAIQWSNELFGQEVPANV